MTAILYSFRRCPYAIRARLALHAVGVSYELREVVLKDKPASMLELSSKGTVPVLLVGEQVFDESLDVMRWAFEQKSLYRLDLQSLEHELVIRNDIEFKQALDKYKYFDRYPEQPQDAYLQEALPFLQQLEEMLGNHQYLLGSKPSSLDLAIFPFVRQFALVDKAKFDDLPLPQVQRWLESWLNSDLFQQVMGKYPQWQAEHSPLLITPESVIWHLADEQRFEIRFEDSEAAVLRYRFEQANKINFFSTVVPTSQRGKGTAARLVDHGFAWAEKAGLQLFSTCWYAEKRLAQRLTG